MITTAGLAALGAASFAPAFAQDDAMANQKPWAIGASLRGFYDDNYFTLPRALRTFVNPTTGQKFDDDTFGFDISPNVAVNLKSDQTTFGFSYLYGFRYFVDRPRPRDDQSHQVNLKLSHAFSERFSLDAKDSFVVAQEPAVLDPSISVTLPARSEGNNVRNYGSLQLNAAVLENFSVLAGYANTFYDYQEDATRVARQRAFPGGPLVNPAGIGSRSALLDRMEHLIFVDGNYQILPKTTLSLGYQYQITDFTSMDPLIGALPGDIRDNTSHFVTVGVKQHVNPQLDLSGKVGVQFTQYDSPLFSDDTSPYAEASARWAYMQNSSVQLGVKHQRIATDVRLIGAAPVADQEATTVYLSVNHAVTSKITAIAMAQYQHSDYGSSTPGTTDATDEIFYGGITLAYQFNLHIAAEVGYTYDRLDSDFTFRSYSRNRVFIGTRLSY